jgi:hypothetical protein
MGNYNHKPNSGSMFVNDEKDPTNPAHQKFADRQGDGLIECPACQAQFAVYLNGWLKEGKNKTKFLSVSIKPKRTERAERGAGAPRTQAAPPRRHAAPPPKEPSGDDAPFDQPQSW